MTDPVQHFADELRKWWSFNDHQIHTHSWHTREDFIRDKLPGLLAAMVPTENRKIVKDEQGLLYVTGTVTQVTHVAKQEG